MWFCLTRRQSRLHRITVDRRHSLPLPVYDLESLRDHDVVIVGADRCRLRMNDRLFCSSLSGSEEA